MAPVKGATGERSGAAVFDHWRAGLELTASGTDARIRRTLAPRFKGGFAMKGDRLTASTRPAIDSFSRRIRQGASL
jgi:predicted secreted protein